MDDEAHSRHLEIVWHGFREQFESGDKLALLDCIRWCEEYGLTLPSWALHALSEATRRYLSGTSENFHDAIFGARKDVGRHAKPSTARAKQRTHQLWFDLIWALKRQGFTGEPLYEQAHELLKVIAVDSENRLLTDGAHKHKQPKPPQPETIKKRVQQMKKEDARPSGFAHLIPLMVDITRDRTHP